MSRKTARIEVAVRLSRHNDEQDQIDDRLYAELVGRIRALVDDPRYSSIDPNIVSEV